MISIKVIEALLAVYALGLGLLFLVDPGVLAAPVYEAWGGLGSAIWGEILIALAGLHTLALYWNGRNRIASRAVRAVAVTFSLTTSISFAGMFLSGGAPWGAWTYVCMMCSLQIIVASRVIDEIKLLWGDLDV